MSLHFGFAAAILGITFGFLAVAPSEAGQLLDRTFPRGKKTCFAAKARSGQTAAIEMIRLTRPERLQSYDSKDSRIVRVVVNFSGKTAQRVEDSVNCRDENGRITCQSTTCDGSGFSLEPLSDGGVMLRQKSGSPDVIWSCETDDLRTIELTETETMLRLSRATGSCL